MIDGSRVSAQRFAVWLNDRYAYMGTMQVGPTSLTPRGSKVLGPSIWLIDVQLACDALIVQSRKEFEAKLRNEEVS